MQDMKEMQELFLDKINRHEYISTFLFKHIEDNYPDIIPDNFNLDNYNDLILEKQYLQYQDYFDKMYQGIDDHIHLDKEQIKAILADEEYSLIIAGAGTGKTTTMASKVKYLVDIKKIDPSKIVVMSFTKKATEELERRIVVDFGIPALVTTFHTLGMMYIREIFRNRKCYVVDTMIQNNIFLKYFKEQIFPDQNKVSEILSIFDAASTSKTWVFGNYFKEHYHEFSSFDKYFESYKKAKRNEVEQLSLYIHDWIEKQLNGEVIFTIKGEQVKSKGEALIANFLYCYNIEYQYEKVYDHLMPENRVYRPDFTLNLSGEDVYVEYFGLSNYDKDGMNRYNKIKKMKEDYHQKHHTKFIKLDYVPGENVLQSLEKQLIDFGFTLKRKSDEEIFDTILDNNPFSQFYPFRDFLFEAITQIKSSSKRKEYKAVVQDYLDHLQTEEKILVLRQFEYINDFYLYYQKELFGAEDYGFDFSDMIYYANQYIANVGVDHKMHFDYLIIDEYQDISMERYEFTKNIATKNHAKVVAVGDDWQSIYAFAGSKIEYIYQFEKYFYGAKLLRITQTYRNSQSLIDYSGDFIMKNQSQIKKNLKSEKVVQNPIRFVMFDENEEYEVLKKLILKIHHQNPSHRIMILGRTNAIIDGCYRDPDFKDAVGTKIEFVGFQDLDLDGMTIHKSKGLTSDEVIVIGLDRNFPRSNNGLFWLKDLFMMRPVSENIPFAEERRLFYVALTRTKNYVYLLVNKNIRNRSPFIMELYHIIKNKELEDYDEIKNT